MDWTVRYCITDERHVNAHKTNFSEIFEYYPKKLLLNGILIISQSRWNRIKWPSTLTDDTI